MSLSNKIFIKFDIQFFGWGNWEGLENWCEFESYRNTFFMMIIAPLERVNNNSPLRYNKNTNCKTTNMKFLSKRNSNEIVYLTMVQTLNL